MTYRSVHWDPLHKSDLWSSTRTRRDHEHLVVVFSLVCPFSPRTTLTLWKAFAMTGWRAYSTSLSTPSSLDWPSPPSSALCPEPGGAFPGEQPTEQFWWKVIHFVPLLLPTYWLFTVMYLCIKCHSQWRGAGGEGRGAGGVCWRLVRATFQSEQVTSPSLANYSSKPGWSAIDSTTDFYLGGPV